MEIRSENDSRIENQELGAQHVSGGKSRWVPSPFPSNRRRAAVCKANTDSELQCDEGSPACVNCTRRNLQCSFTAPSSPAAINYRNSNELEVSSGVSPQSLPGLTEGPSDDLRLQRICSASPQAYNEEIEEIKIVETNRMLTGTVGAFLSMSAADRELLQYFETCTSQNLAMSDTIWHTTVLKWAVQVRLPLFNVTSIH